MREEETKESKRIKEEAILMREGGVRERDKAGQEGRRQWR